MQMKDLAVPALAQLLPAKLQLTRNMHSSGSFRKKHALRAPRVQSTPFKGCGGTGGRVM